jgi:hypothetical protein
MKAEDIIKLQTTSVCLQSKKVVKKKAVKSKKK